MIRPRHPSFTSVGDKQWATSILVFGTIPYFALGAKKPTPLTLFVVENLGVSISFFLILAPTGGSNPWGP